MARTAVETANVLSLMYDESFGGEDMEMFRIGWAELRSLAGVPKLTDEYLARMTRLHNDANVLCLGERVIGAGLAASIADVFLETGFEGGRHQRRVDLIESCGLAAPL